MVTTIQIVTVMAPLEDGMGIRSTSMGNQMLLGNTKYKVAICGLKKFSPLLIVLALSGCVSTPELVIELYQKCKYRNDCIGDRIGEMFNVG